MIGRFIDSLSDDERDRIITADTLYTGPKFVHHACGCLVSTAFAFRSDGDAFRRREGETGHHFLSGLRDDDPLWFRAAALFPILCHRFGADRIIRACKLRAARRDSVLPALLAERENATA